MLDIQHQLRVIHGVIKFQFLNDIKKASRLTISSGQIIGYALQSINSRLEVKDIVKEIVFKIFDSPTDEPPQQDQSTKTETDIKLNLPDPSEYPNNQLELPIETVSIQQEEQPQQPQRIIKQRRTKEENKIFEMQVFEDIKNGMIVKDVCNKYTIDEAIVSRIKTKYSAKITPQV
ncbi:MAG: hypothetical protein HQK63_14570 [Desulfamplus sp.]|nr:hypothetical protein [Desulfamplus sp.]